MSSPNGSSTPEDGPDERQLIDEKLAATVRSWEAQERLRRRILLRAQRLAQRIPTPQPAKRPQDQPRDTTQTPNDANPSCRDLSHAPPARLRGDPRVDGSPVQSGRHPEARGAMVALLLETI